MLIKFILGGDSKPLEKAGKQGQEALIGLKKEYGENLKAAAKWAAGITAAGTAITLALVNRAREVIDTQAKLAQSLNTTSEALAVTTRAGELSGVAFDKIKQSAGDLTRRLSQAAAGAGPAVDALEDLELTAEELIALPLDQRIATINGRIRDMVPLAQQAGMAAKFFGEEGSLAISRLSPETIAQAAEETRVLGVLLSEVDAAQVELANDSFSRLQVAGEGVAQQLAVQLAPILDEIGDRFFETAKEAGGVGAVTEEAVDKAVRSAIGLAASLRPVIQTIKEQVSGIWEAFRGLPPWAQEIGIVGAIMGGKKGVLLLGALSKAAEETKTTAAWFAAMTSGDVPFFEWLTTGEDEARQKLKALGHDLDAMRDGAAGGPSLVGALFGGGEENDQWAADMLAQWDEIRTSSRAAAEEVVRTRATMKGNAIDIPGTGGAAEREKELERLRAQAKATFSATRTEVERAQAAIDDFRATVNALGTETLQSMGINADDVFARLEANLEGLQTTGEETFNGLQVFADQAARNMQDALANFMNGTETDFAQMLQNMASQAASQKILSSLFSWMGGSSNSTLAGFGQMLGKNFASFEGGGFTGYGARAGGLDGKGGKLAIVHPNETYIDHTKGSTGGGSVSNAVNFGSVQFNFPGVTNEDEGRRAGAAAFQEFQSLVAGSRRYA